MSDTPRPNCPPNCGHSEIEHAAFDRGVEDGENLRHCPFDFMTQTVEWDAWQNGASVGRSNLRVTLAEEAKAQLHEDQEASDSERMHGLSASKLSLQEHRRQIGDPRL